MALTEQQIEELVDDYMKEMQPVQVERGKVCAVIGGQYGSEGKGTIVAKIADRFRVHVRVGSHNAGHSFKHYHNGEWSTWKMQQIPVGWINPGAYVVIGRGALISPGTLDREIKAIAAVDSTIRQRLIIDADAGVLEPHHFASEGGTAGEIHARIGSTGEGVGAARIDRLRRAPYGVHHPRDAARHGHGFRRFLDMVQQEPEYAYMESYVRQDTPLILNEMIRHGHDVLLEGSQGVGLSLVHGPWPYVTTTDCGVAQLCADTGIPPTWVTDVLCVLRTYPIRVAGQSGPLKNEISWAHLSSILGRDVIEHTTVTKKVRRIGQWDDALVQQAVVMNAPTAFAVNFLDYLSPENEGVTRRDQLASSTQDWLRALEQRFDIPVLLMGTGGPTWTVIEDERGF